MNRTKEQNSEYCKNHYAKNKEKRKDQIKSRRHDLAVWFQEYKSSLCCTRCPENHPSCLQFHHNDPTEKEIEISKAITNGWSKDRILKEIEKCTVLCANCHCKEHSCMV